MSKNVSEELVNSANDILNKIIKSSLQHTAVILNYRIEKKWEQFIDEFYESYDPSLYSRTGSTYKASDRYDENLPELINNHLQYKWQKASKVSNNTTIAGIIVDAKNIGENPYQGDLEWVFNRTFEEGIHGYTRAEARSHSWSFRKNQEPLKPTPYQRMDKYFKTITEKYCNDLFQENGKRAMNNYMKGKI